MFARKLVAALPAAIARRCPLAKCSRPRELACFETLAWSGSRWCCKRDVGRAVHVREGTDSSAGPGRCAAHPASENWQPQALFESPCLGGRLARRQQHTSKPFNRAVPQPHVLSRVLAPTLPALPCTESQGPSGRAKSGTHSEACLAKTETVASRIQPQMQYHSDSVSSCSSTSGSSCFAAKLRQCHCQWSNLNLFDHSWTLWVPRVDDDRSGW